jgi:hypothetical protein
MLEHNLDGTETEHFPCGVTWLEESARHGGFVDLDNPAFVLIRQYCRSRIPNGKALDPRCCQRPELSYHDTREPCEICRHASNPTPSGRAGRDA